MSAPSYASVHDLAEKVYSEYRQFGYIRNKHYVEDPETKFKPVDTVVAESGALPGDILFLGSHYDTRQEYGFAIKTEDGWAHDEESAYIEGPKGLVEYAKKLYPHKNYRRAYNELCAKWKVFNCHGAYFLEYEQDIDVEELVTSLQSQMKQMNSTVEKISKAVRQKE